MSTPIIGTVTRNNKKYTLTNYMHEGFKAKIIVNDLVTESHQVLERRVYRRNRKLCVFIDGLMYSEQMFVNNVKFNGV